nr:LrgB family protein [uncultured Bacillus sp.]
MVYLAAMKVSKKYPSPFTTPVFLSTVIIIFLLSFSRISYKEYQLAKDIMTFLLGPATVALAVPLYKHRHILFQNLIPAFVGLFVGSFTTILSALMLAKVFNLAHWILLSLSIKSITIPVAAEVAKIIGADSVLVAAIVMITGMIGAMFGPWLLNKFHIYHPFARGISIGTIAHGIGTAEAAREGELQGAVSGVAMGLAAIFTAIFIPVILPLIFH